MFEGEFVERFIDRQQLIVWAGSGQLILLVVQPFKLATVALGLLPAGTIDENVAHRLGGRKKEMPAVSEFHILGTHQSQPGFMNQCGWLQRLAGSLLSHFEDSQPSQFVIHDFNQLVASLGIGIFNCARNGFGIAHTTYLMIALLMKVSVTF